MSTALYQKDTASRLRAQLRRKAISLYYNNKGPQPMTFEDVARKMQLPQKYIEKWITRYEKTGLHGYVGQRQSAILCIYKKNPNITLSQLRILLKKVGIVLSNNELGHILKNLKHILTDPMFKSASEEQILRKLSKVTKVQAKSVIRMNQKMRLEKEKAEGREHPYAHLKKSIFLDHSYVAYPELSYDEDDYSLYDNVDKLAKYKTDLMNKIATVSKNLDNLFDSNHKEEQHVGKDTKRYKISLLREQLLYLCLEMKGPKLTTTELTQNLPLKEAVVNKWIDQAKNIKRFVHAKHVNKCCGKIQETIVRLVKLNSTLTTDDIKNILRQVNIDLSNLKLERQLNSVKYMINGPEDFTDKEFEEMEMNEVDIDYCIKVLTLKITSVNMKKTKCPKGEKPSSKQLSLQNIIESCSTEKCRSASSSPNPKRVDNDHIYQYSLPDQNSENRVEKARHNLHEELTNIYNNNERQKHSNDPFNKHKSRNYEAHETAELILNNKRIFNGEMNGLNLLQAVTLNEVAKYGLTNKSSRKESSPVNIKYNQKVMQSKRNRTETEKFNEDFNLLQYISVDSNDHSDQIVNYFNNQKEQQIEQTEVIEEHVYNIDLDEHNIPYEDTVKENTSPNCFVHKENLLNYKHQLDYLQPDTNSYNNVIIDEPMSCENVKINTEQIISATIPVVEDKVTISSVNPDTQLEDQNTVTEEDVINFLMENNPNKEIDILEEHNLSREIEILEEHNIIREMETVEEHNICEEIETVQESNINKETEITEERNINREIEVVYENNINRETEMMVGNNVRIEMSDDVTVDDGKLDTPTIENALEEMEAESGIDSLILDNKAQEEDEKIVSNLLASSDESSNFIRRKRKFSENDTFESEESEFEPIDDLSFIGLDSDSDALVKEETDDSEKEIMTEYIECEDNSVVIKYWIAT